jgi:8-oxo-dGTP pyrophosphatase MutT (NUDIX family)
MSLKWAGVILFNREGELLLLLRDNIPTIGHPNHWNIVGGVIEKGESPEEAALREVHEEIGLRLTGVSLFRRYEIDDDGRDEPVPYFVYWSRLDKNVAELTLGEGQAMRFFHREELPALRIIPHEVGILQDFLTSLYDAVKAS